MNYSSPAAKHKIVFFNNFDNFSHFGLAAPTLAFVCQAKKMTLGLPKSLLFKVKVRVLFLFQTFHERIYTFLRYFRI